MTSRNGSLDILRCIAIVAVVNCHVTSTFVPPGQWPVLQIGAHGVDLFFALSGWLLGRQLLIELARSGTIDLWRFWLRRWLRTLPAYYAILIFTYAWQILLKQNYDLDLTYLFFIQTYCLPMPYFGVSWSLCVEEHFYLAVAPFILAAARTRWIAWTTFAILLLPSICRMMGWYDSIYQTHVRYDQCAIGVVLAFLNVHKPMIWAWLCRVALPLALLSLIPIGYLVCTKQGWLIGIMELPIMLWAFLFSTWVLLANSSAFWQERLRFLVTRVLADRAYALYLVHIEAIVIVNKLEVASFGWNLLLTWSVALALAELLYRGIERPFMSLRERFSASRSQRSEKQSKSRTPNSLSV